MSNRRYLNNIVHLRGVMVLLVVIGHALSIFVDDYAGHQMIESALGSGLRKIIYSFHMPVFMEKTLFFLADVSAYDGMSAMLKLQAFLSIRTTGALWFLYVLFIIFVVQRLLIKVIWKSNKIVLTWIYAFVAVNIASY